MSKSTRLDRNQQAATRRSSDSLNRTNSSNARQKVKLKQNEQNRVNVAVRCRPLSEKELKAGYESIVEFEGKTKIIVHNTYESPSDQLGTNSGERNNLSHVFEFNAVFGCDATQEHIYNQISRPIVDCVLQGYNGTIFAYGQTGTGKTYTMEGVGACQLSNRVQNELAGIIPRAFQHIFQHISNNNDNVQFLIRVSYLEIYQEEIYDLLRKNQSIKLELHEKPDIGVYVQHLTSIVCNSQADIERVMKVGNQNRKVGATDMNERSSRSHAIFTITVEQQQQQQQKVLLDSKKQQEGIISANLMSSNQSSASSVIKVGKLNLVDLAGSERQRKTNSFGQRQRESIKINLSLSTLGNVINSLMKLNNSIQQQSNSRVTTTSEANLFIPYRDSKLTRLLQDSLGGNAKTLMIANIGPASYNYDETINTLNYASRAKCIQNRPKLNEDPKDTLLRELQLEISELRAKLAAMSIASVNNETQDDSSRNEKTKKKSKDALVDQKRLEREFVDLKEKLSSLESKLLSGGYKEVSNNGDSITARGVTAIDRGSQLLQGYTNKQEIELEKRRAELAKQEDREREIRDELERRKYTELQARETFSSIQQEIDTKKRLIRQILLKISTMRTGIKSSQDAYRLELDELEQLQYNLQKDLKLKCMVMDNFIPNEHVDQLLPRIVYDENRNLCSVIPIEISNEFCKREKDGNLVAKTLGFDDIWDRILTDGCSIRPRTESERIGETIYHGNVRYKYENLIQPKLDVPQPKPRNLFQSKSTNISFPFKNSSGLQTLIDSALEQHELDILI